MLTETTTDMLPTASPPLVDLPPHCRESQQSLKAELLHSQEAELEANEQVRRLDT